MSVIAQIFVGVAGVFHLAVFAMERPRRRRAGRPGDHRPLPRRYFLVDLKRT
jgi:hypothetical protein